MDSNKTLFTEHDLHQLEKRVDQLLDNVRTLKNENDSLRHLQQELEAERSQLLSKTEMAQTRVEAIIAKLKSLEHNS